MSEGECDWDFCKVGVDVAGGIKVTDAESVGEAVGACEGVSASVTVGVRGHVGVAVALTEGLWLSSPVAEAESDWDGC